jgi:hypothetical protein
MFRLCTFVAALAAVVAAGGLAVAADDKADLDKFRKLPEAAKAILDKADQLEVFSLDPERPEQKPKDDFHGWKVLGKTAVEGAEARQKVVDALYKGIAEGQGAAGCFRPRHGVRATSGDKTVDLVICFECVSMEVHVGGDRAAVWTSAAPQKALDRILRAAKVPLPPKPKDE